MTRIFLAAPFLCLAAPASAQLMPADIAPGLLLRATHENYAERARNRGKVEKSATELAKERACAARWQRRQQMGRAERNRLYDECPR